MQRISERKRPQEFTTDVKYTSFAVKKQISLSYSGMFNSRWPDIIMNGNCKVYRTWKQQTQCHQSLLCGPGWRAHAFFDQLTYLQILCLSENGEEIVHVQNTELQRYLWKRTEWELNFSETGCTVHTLREVPHHSYLCLQWTTADLALVNYA